jgi:Fe-S cluster assembly protein SufD
MQVKRKVRRTGEPSFGFSSKDVELISSANDEPEWLVAHRQEAWKQWNNLPLPSLSDEAWRRTDLGDMPSSALIRGSSNGVAIDERLTRPLTSDQNQVMMILRPGHEPQISGGTVLQDQGIVFTDWKSGVGEHSEQMKDALGKAVPSSDGKFAALAAALTEDGVIVLVPAHVHAAQPLHSLLWAPGGAAANFSRVLVVLGEGSSLTFLHESASPTEPDAEALHAGIVELHVGAGAKLTFVEIQNWGQHVWNFTHERALIQRDGSIDWIFAAVGSLLTKNFSELSLDGQGANGRMSGFFFADGRQHLDHDTQQNHMAPNTTSDLLFKGALVDRSRSVWQGMIHVAPGAKKSDGYQANRNLLLSKHARADSIPGLEILADDVRCTHGATVSQLEQDPIFYLMTRGLPRKDAERLAVEGFFASILDRVPLEAVKARFRQMIEAKFASA